ncbi:peroxiredoxin-like family protein [Sinorhizobium sp. BG8]|uniref:peroxiredoxin-like family protein n=1 Tax=Sinorhizobium sp. BG8 TaxID=2613773 RepID=UPI00193DB001|nr:peroxiredoxin-like family protein [Sinorhizobium sp. BG8]QRM57600.1 AhpC/TSA family protein [Sinorhizobium sp. BG8]
MSLHQPLRKTAEDPHSSLPDRLSAVIDELISELESSRIAQKAAGLGTVLPLPVLPDQDGNSVDLSELAGEGALIITFYRGGWCPFSNARLRELSERSAEIAEHGALLVAISPETADNARKTALRNGLGFPLLGDKGNRLARELGLVFPLPENIRALYHETGVDLAGWNDDARHELPIVATYIVDSNGTARWALVDADFTRRADAAGIVAALKRAPA